MHWDKIRRNFTLDFLDRHIPPDSNLLDLGGESVMAQEMRHKYRVEVSGDYDLDLHPNKKTGAGFDAVTSFEVFEHLINPFGVLQAIEAPRLICSVPLSVWFRHPWRGPTRWDWHYHEFKDWQFDMLLEKAGWSITDRKRLIVPNCNFGIRPILRGDFLTLFYPRFYFVAAVRAR